MKDFATLLGYLALIAVALVYGPLTYGLISWKFYQWFNLDSVLWIGIKVTYLDFVGLYLLLAVLKTSNMNQVKKEYQISDGEKWAMILIGPWLMLFIGWLFKIIFF
jgi:hypothetical protein